MSPVDALVVPESRFFREPEAFDALAAWGAACLAARAAARDARPLRVLCVPCGAGEEAYSIVLALVAAGIAPDRVRVDAYDRDEAAVERARAALYDADAPRAGLMHATGGGWTVAPAVRAAVRARVGDLLHPSLAATDQRYDAIFCRDRLFDLDATMQERTLAQLDQLLASDGLLFVGSLDRFAAKRAGLRLAGFPAAYVYCSSRATAPVPGAPVIPIGRRQTPLGLATLKARATGGRLPSERPFGAAVAPALAPPLAPPPLPPPPRAAVAAASAGTSAAVESDLARAERLSDIGQFREAEAACEAHLRVEPSSVAAWALLGLLSDALGELERATACYRRVLELDPRHPDALLHLAVVGDRAASRSAS